jgi:hypothetical protein
VKLAWLVSPQTKETLVFFDGSVERVSFTDNLDGKTILPGLSLLMSEVIDE